MSHSLPGRIVMGIGALLALALVYLFQGFDYARFVAGGTTLNPNTVFVINRTIRLVINDLACMLLIFAIFRRKSYLTVAFYVFLFELFVVLPAYLIIKLSLEGDSEISSPLLSFVHRLVVNPMLMIVLMGGFFYQKFSGNAGIQY